MTKPQGGIARRLLRHPAPWVLLLTLLLPAPSADNRSLLGLPTLCPMRALTGIPCPGCGMTRSLICCGHGQLARGVVLHPLGPVFFAVLIGVVVLRLMPGWQPSRRAVTAGAVVLTVALLLLWIARLLHWLPPAP